MTSLAGDLKYEILARGHHGGGHYGGSGDGSSGPMEWWMWVILAIGVIAILWSFVKKFTN
ncbi:hypothetical protein AB0D04_22605 [Streptomyces sp. NPDC048483]|uniref:hypothetical protein n=1 Tax=Streptomyces sp. NPDC048483 TaxID=3154927 RepID=UPI00341BAF71